MNITTIIPVHEFNDTVKKYLESALISINNQLGINELIPVTLIFASKIEKEISEFVNEFKFEHINLIAIKNENKTDFQSQINFGVENINTEYFSILEFDDEYGVTYFKNANKHIETYPKNDILLSLMIETDEQNQAVKLTNETVWAQQFVGENGEIGYLNINMLNQYTDFKISGAIIKKSEFKNIGGLKSNIKLTNIYEFLLRALNNACKIYSIPKIGYKHLATREGSLFHQYSTGMSINERKFWFEVAKRESNFISDRLIDTSSINN